MPPSLRTALEMLLYGLGPAWQLAASMRDELAAACTEWALARDGDGRRDDGALDRAAWVLHRVLPMGEVEPFRTLRLRGWLRYATYAWGRRAPEEMLAAPPEEFQCWTMQAAWIDTRASDEELLDWPRVMRERGWETEVGTWSSTLWIEEYVRRNPDPHRLMGAVGGMRGGASIVVLEYLLGAVAGELLRTPEPPEDIVAPLRHAGHEELAEAVAGRKPWHKTAVAARAWVRQHTDIDALLKAEWKVPYEPMRRLAAITPRDRFDVWDDILRRPERGNFPIRLFCEWLDPRFREVLIREFDREDLDWAAYAFHAYVHMAPREVVERLAEDDRRPAWQAEALDRFLHAPTALKPPPHVTNTQETEADCRLYDPLNVRAF